MEDVFKVGVIGSGTMGKSIAISIASHGIPVFLCTRSKNNVSNIRLTIDKTIQKFIDKGKINLEVCSILNSNIHVGLLENSYNCDLVIESIVEDYNLKSQLLVDLDLRCKQEAIFATNTSSLSISKLASNVKQHSFVGLHFFNPAYSMKLVEVVRTNSITEEQMNLIDAFLLKIEKEVILAPDASGFVVNRLLLPYINDAISLLEEGRMSPEVIDKCMTLGAGLPMGPLALADYIGLDVCMNILNNMFEFYQDSKFKPNKYLCELVAKGYLGKKVKHGFYQYK